MNKPLLLLAAALLAAATRAPAEGRPFQLDGVAAEVGGVRITISDVMAEAREIAFAEGRTDVVGNPEAVRALYGEALTNLVNRRLVLLQYEQGEAKIPDWYFNQRIERIIETGFGGDKSKLVAALEGRGLSYQEWRKRRVDDMVVGTMRQQFIDQSVKVRPSEIEAAYREKYADAKLPGHVKVSMVMLAGDGESVLAQARELVDELRGGKRDFAATARELSKEGHAAEGGCWGYIEPADELRKELADALVPLAVGGVSAPVAVGGYTYILRKDDERKDLSVPLDLVRDEIEGDLRQAAGEARYAAWLRFLATKNTVRVFPLK